MITYPIAVEGITLLVDSHDSPAILGYNGYNGTLDLNPFASNPEFPASYMVVGPDGDVYTSIHGQDRVSRYDWPTGVRIGTFVGDEEGSGPGTQPGIRLDGPGGLAFGPDGDLYVVSGHHYNLLRYDGTTGILLDTIELGLSINPISVGFDPGGGLYISSLGTNSILKWNGSSFDTFTSPGSGLNFPTEFEFGPDGNLYVCSAYTDSVMRYDGTTGAFIDEFVTPGSGGLDFPNDLTFGPDGNLYVVGAGPPYTSNGVLRYDGSSGSFMNVFAPNGNNTLVFIPEPGMLSLLALGGLAMVRRRRLR